MLLVICSTLALVAAIYYVFNRLADAKYNYFKKRGIPQLKTHFLYGNSKDVVLQKKFPGELNRDFYNQFKKMGVAHGGVYEGRGKSWIPVDPELIKNILTKDFIHFSAHLHGRMPGLFFNNIFHMDGEEWKDMRKKLTPTFTSGKMKMMFEIIQEKTNGLANLMDTLSKEPFDITHVMVRFTLDIIATCAFGIESNSLEDINSDFYKNVMAGFGNSDEKKEKKEKKERYPRFKFILQQLGLVKHPFPNFKPIEDFFREVVRQTLQYREENRVIRKDFVHLMIQLKNKGAVTELTNANEDVFSKTVDQEVMSFEDIAGECLLFLSAGFGTSSTAMSFAMLELAQNQDVQKKLRQSVREVLNRHNGKLTYEALQELTYCENVVYETLRKYPTLPFLYRVCTKDYKIPGTDIVIEKGTNAPIPAWGLHMDPDNFPNPEKFMPERFDAENKKNIKDFTFLPFGEGPRMCLGLRFGMMQSKAGLATLVNKFHFTLNKKTPYPPNFNKTAPAPAVDGGVWLDAVKVD